MAEKEYSPLFKNKHNIIFVENLDGQFNNLNLNQNHQNSSDAFSKLPKNVSTEKRKALNYGKKQECCSQFLNSESKLWDFFSAKDLPSIVGSNDYGKELKKEKSSTAKMNSTLSLHISAYENSTESVSLLDGTKKSLNQNNLIKEGDNLKQFFVASIQNPFEFPRQQENDKSKTPETAQFKASLRLINPNSTPSKKSVGRHDKNIIKNVMGECFVTLGTTQFDDLVQAVLSFKVKQALKNVGIDKLVIQCGAGNAIRSLVPEGLKDKDQGCFVEDDCGLKIEYFRYKKSIQADMKSASLIIGHAGAGTCLESLKLHKPMVTVVNDKLMDNHQTELADRLSELGHLICTTPSQLHKALTNDNLLSPKLFQPSKPNLFSNYLYSKLGYVVTD